jgi:hypothetical protein
MQINNKAVPQGTAYPRAVARHFTRVVNQLLPGGNDSARLCHL